MIEGARCLGPPLYATVFCLAAIACNDDSRLAWRTKLAFPKTWIGYSDAHHA